jgi:hypothetical protein
VSGQPSPRAGPGSRRPARVSSPSSRESTASSSRTTGAQREHPGGDESPARGRVARCHLAAPSARGPARHGHLTVGGSSGAGVDSTVRHRGHRRRAAGHAPQARPGDKKVRIGGNAGHRASRIDQVRWFEHPARRGLAPARPSRRAVRVDRAWAGLLREALVPRRVEARATVHANSGWHRREA